jgi:hypothetical protein
MREDAVISEVRRYREQRAATFGYDIRAIAEDAKKRERESGRQIVSFARPRRPTQAREKEVTEE